MASTLNALPDSMAWSTHDKSDDFIMYKRSASARVDAFNTQSQSSQATPPLRRQMTVTFSMACCLCGKKSVKDRDFHSSVKTNLLFQEGSRHLDGKESAQRQQSWWQEGWQLLGSRRKTRSWTDKDTSGDEAYSRLPKWKQLFRKLRAETRKMSCVSQSPGFNYDPLSYAMNFDEGCWQCDLHGQSYLHSMRFSAPMVLESESFRSQTVPDSRTGKTSDDMLWTKFESLPHSRNLPVWQRRKACNPPALDLKMVRVWRPAYTNI